MYLLTVILCVLFLISYKLFGDDIFSPSVLFFVGYLLCAFIGIYDQHYWDISINSKLVLIFVVGWLSFFLGEVLVNKCTTSNKAGLIYVKKSCKINRINYNCGLLLFFISVNLFVCILLIYDLAKSGVEWSSVLDLTYEYKNSEDISLSPIVTQCLKITKGSAYVYLVVFINNFYYIKVNKQNFKLKNLLLLIPGIIYCLQCFIKGGRYNIIAYFFSLVFLVFFYRRYIPIYGKKIKLWTWVKLIILGCMVIWLFWYVRQYVGRDNEDDDFMFYIGKYLGGSYKLFNMYLENPPANKSYEVFSGLLTSFNKLFNLSIETSSYPEFRFSETGILIGNTYTAIRNFYNDFGLVGVALLCFIQSIFFNYVYVRLKKNDINKNIFLLILYASLLWVIPYSFFYDYFYARLSFGYLVEVIIMYCIYYVVCKTKFIFKAK